jgi:hypothetical protein
MEWLSDRELGALDDLLRGTAGPGDVSAFLATLEGLVALCRAFPRLSHEVRSARGELQRLRQGIALESENARRLERALAVARGTIEGLERQVRAA